MRDCNHVLIVDCPRSSIICVIDSGSFSNNNSIEQKQTRTNKQTNHACVPCHAVASKPLILCCAAPFVYYILYQHWQVRGAHPIYSPNAQIFTNILYIHALLSFQDVLAFARMRSLGKRPKIAALSNCDECWGKVFCELCLTVFWLTIVGHVGSVRIETLISNSPADIAR